MESLLYEKAEIIENSFDKWVDELKRSNKPYGEIMAEIWNQYAEDRANDSLLLFDLNNRDDFNKYYIDCDFINEIRNGRKVPMNKDRWALFNYSADDSKHRFVVMDDDGLVGAVRANLIEIVECMIAFPSLYPRDFYEAVMWDWIRDCGLIVSFEL